MKIENQEIYENLKPFDEISLDCYGYVSAIREGRVEAVLMLPNRRELRRLFNSDLSNLFVERGIYYTDAPFRFIVTNYQSKLSTHVITGKPPEGYPGTVKMPKFDFSVLERFETKESSE